MNQASDSPLQHGRLAQILLRCPRKRAKLPKALQLSTNTCDDAETVNAQSIRVSGPYRTGTKWRLVVFDPKRAAKLFDDYETALLAKERLLAEVDGRLSKTIGDLVSEFVEYKRRLGCVERTVRAVLPDANVALATPVADLAETLKALPEFSRSEQFRQLATAFKRVRNIGREYPAEYVAAYEAKGAALESLLEETAEKALVA